VRPDLGERFLAVSELRDADDASAKIDPGRIDDLLNRRPPEHLYHYTDQAGLLGILDSGQLWATKIQYMNDTTEFSLAVKLAEQLLTARLSERKDRNKRISLRTVMTILQRLQRISNVNICAVSFCEDPDVLSQWRGYAGGTGGVAIGFQSRALNLAAAKNGGRLSPCIYDASVQAEVTTRIINDILINANATGSSDDCDLTQHAASFERRLIEIGALFKNSGFQEESEWRLITGIRSYNSKEFLITRQRQPALASGKASGWSSAQRMRGGGS
jgi:Protein of unknown function (DUF2971)